MQKPPSESKDEVYLRKRKVYSILSLVVLFAIFTAATALLWKPFAATFRDPAYFREWVNGKGLGGRFIFVGAVVLQMIFAIIPGEPLEIGGGYAFGAFWGTVLCMLGAVLGSVAVFFLVRRLGRPLVELFFPPDKLKKLRFLQTSPRRNALFALIFTVPGTPKDLLCYFAGLTDMKFSTWLLLCSVGRIPSILTSTLGGNALGLQNYTFAVIVFLATLAVSGAGLLVYRAVCRRHAEKQ